MDKVAINVAEQLEDIKDISYEITEWVKHSDNRYRELQIDFGKKVKLIYQQSNNFDYFYTGRIVDEFDVSKRRLEITISIINENYKRDVEFVRSNLPEIEVLLAKIQAYKKLAI